MLSGTVPRWSPDFPPLRSYPRSGGRPTLWQDGLSGNGICNAMNSIVPHWSRQEQRKKFRPAFAIHDPVDRVRPKASLKRPDSCERVGHIVSEPFEREEKTGIGPMRIH